MIYRYFRKYSTKKKPTPRSEISQKLNVEKKLINQKKHPILSAFSGKRLRSGRDSNPRPHA